MNFVKYILGINAIYDRKYGGAFLIDPVMLFCIVSLSITLVAAFIPWSGPQPILYNHTSFILSFSAGFATLYAARELAAYLYVSHIIKKRNYVTNTGSHPRSMIFDSAASSEFGKITIARYIRGGKGWMIYDARSDFYRKNKYGRSKSKESYYTVYEGNLPTKVPNVVFDSRGGKGRQFRFVYSGSQEVSFEGDFNKYFTVYSPHFYKTDSMSFITPEVMLAMKGCAQYDIEFVGDSMLVYGPLMQGHELESFERSAQAVHRHVYDNLTTYKDIYAKAFTKTKKVMPFARKLLPNPTKHIPGIVISGIVSGLFIFLAVSKGPLTLLLGQLPLSAFIIFLSLVFSFIRTTRSNNQEIAQFKGKQTTVS